MKHFMALKLTTSILSGIVVSYILANNPFGSLTSGFVSISIALFGIFIIFVGEKPTKTTLLQSKV